MKHKILVIMLCLLIGIQFDASANGITISNVTVTNNGTIGTLHFNLTWFNSWNSGATGNHDAAMIFAKFKDHDGQWKPLTFAAGGYTDQAGYFTGTLGGASVNHFIYRNTPGVGTTNLTDVKIDIINPPIGNFDVRIYGIEMVQIPSGVFSVGDGVSNGFYRDGISSNPFQVLSAIPPVMGTAAGQLNDLLGNGSLGTTANDFPTGFSEFYIMKYEISQGAYRDFLNSLRYSQQVTRTANLPDGSPGDGALTTPGNARNYLELKTPGTGPLPAVYGCDASSNNIFDEANDGEWVACNFLSWMDIAAYLDWAGLRPMSEMEYEKATATRIGSVFTHNPAQYAWGNDLIHPSAYLHSNFSTATEGVTNASTIAGNAIYFGNGAGGPHRNGLFATATSNVMTSGATFWGVMEMSGNLFEATVTTANNAGRSFRKLTLGDGLLDANGNAVQAWPGANGNTDISLPVTNGPITASAGSGARGGSLFNAAEVLRSCERGSAISPLSIRQNSGGGRGVFVY